MKSSASSPGLTYKNSSTSKKAEFSTLTNPLMPKLAPWLGRSGDLGPWDGVDVLKNLETLDPPESSTLQKWPFLPFKSHGLPLLKDGAGASTCKRPRASHSLRPLLLLTSRPITRVRSQPSQSAGPAKEGKRAAASRRPTLAGARRI